MRLMKRVARRVTMSLCESKRFTILNEQYVPSYVTPTPFNWTLRDVFFPIPQANTAAGANAVGSSYAKVGSEIVDPLVKVKGSFTVNWGLIGANNPGSLGTMHMHFYIIASTTDSPLPGIVTNYDFTLSGDPVWFLNSDPARPTLNGNTVKVIKHVHRRVTPDQLVYTGTGPVYVGTTEIPFSLKWRKKGKLTFEEVSVATAPNFLTSSVTRGWRYYFLAGWGTAGGALASAARPTIEVDSFVYYKDP